MLSLDLSKDHIADCTDRATKIVAGVDDVLTSLESDALFAFLRDKYLNEEPARHNIQLCPKCGFNGYEVSWKKEEYCPSCGTFGETLLSGLTDYKV
jgi:predicted Zn-ribbon and HTH transcriptional regulator